MLYVVTCTLGKVRIEHEISVAHTLWPMAKMAYHEAIIGLSIDDARNTAFTTAVDQDYEYVMFWDDDIISRDKNVIKLIVSAMDQNPEIDILGGVYPRRSEFPEPIVCEVEGGGSWWGWEDGKLHKVWMTGTGFTVYRTGSLSRLVYETDKYKIEQTNKLVWPFFSTSPEESDDFNFADKCREDGLNWYVHGGVVCEQIDLESGHRFRVEGARVRI